MFHGHHAPCSLPDPRPSRIRRSVGPPNLAPRGPQEPGLLRHWRRDSQQPRGCRVGRPSAVASQVTTRSLLSWEGAPEREGGRPHRRRKREGHPRHTRCRGTTHEVGWQGRRPVGLEGHGLVHTAPVEVRSRVRCRWVPSGTTTVGSDARTVRQTSLPPPSPVPPPTERPTTQRPHRHRQDSGDEVPRTTGVNTKTPDHRDVTVTRPFSEETPKSSSRVTL